MKPEIIIIAAICKNNALGHNGELLYHIPTDLRHFKELTMGWPIIMGRKTFESFPKGPLPGRRNIIISRNPEYHPPGTEVYASPEDALQACSDTEKVYIIGGGEIYRLFLPIANKLELTEIDAEPNDADTYFPNHDFKLTKSGDWQGETPRYRFRTYNRPA